MGESAAPAVAERESVARTTGQTRLIACLMSLAFLSVIALSMWLTPDKRGYGTHEQLGMPPCGMMYWLGVPCPMCGMTTAFTFMAHGEISNASQTQPAGAVGFVACCLLAVAAAACVIRPSWFSYIFEGQAAAWMFRFGLVVVMLAWTYKIMYHFK
ncbi:MAG: hypothetical protein AMXMBFR84_24570 [Candidatus Hydrogenedentota bacterium]